MLKCVRSLSFYRTGVKSGKPKFLWILRPKYQSLLAGAGFMSPVQPLVSHQVASLAFPHLY